MQTSLVAVMLMTLAAGQHHPLEFRQMQGANMSAADAAALLALNGTNATSSSHDISASYPADLLTMEQIKNGGFIIYLLGNLSYSNICSHDVRLLRHLSCDTKLREPVDRHH